MHRNAVGLLVAVCLLVVPAVANADFPHVVTRGETLATVAATDGLSVTELAAANGISAKAELTTGMILEIPPKGVEETAPTTSTGSTEPTDTGAVESEGGSYVVQRGDTLAAIAARAGTTVDELAALNGIRHENLVIAGTILTLPGGSSATHTATDTGSFSASDVPTTVGSGGPPFPTDQTVSAADIASVADAEGVPPSLAEAIGWQESGFNNSEVSSVGAVGVMQIVPDTWKWIGEHLATTPLQAASASDNVRAGVLLLHALLAQTGSDSGAAAGYYQGLASISRNGEFPSTRRYVASVMALVSRFGG
jgi:N-acetylmuramoyl-L-alanine amidase